MGGFVSLSVIGGTFFWLLGSGVAFLFPILSVKKIGRSYHQSNQVLVGVCLGLAYWLLKLPPYWGLLVVGYVLNSITFSAPTRVRWIGSVLEIVFLIALTYGLILEFVGTTHWERVNQFSTAFLLGSSAMGLIVGHWYLVASGLSFGYLRWFVWAVIAALVLRTLLVLYGGLEGLQTWAPPWDLWEDFYFITRVIVGLIVPLVFSFMALGTLRFKNNQAATGIMYGVFILVLMGELIHSTVLAPPKPY